MNSASSRRARPPHTAGGCPDTAARRLDSEFIGRRIHQSVNCAARLRPHPKDGDRSMALQAAPHVEGAGPPPAIRALGLVKSFGALRAVDNITFDLAPGRIYGLLGPNGSGKTTLIRLLAGLTPPTAGWAEVLGTRMPSRPNLSRIGYMTQADGVYSALTVAENARFFGAMYGVVGDEPAAAALGLVDLADRRASIVGTLAGGDVCRSPAPSSTGRPSCSSTNRPSGSIRSCGSSSGPTSGPSPTPGRQSSSQATPWTRRTGATSSCSCAPARSPPEEPAGRSALKQARPTLSRRSFASAGTWRRPD